MRRIVEWAVKNTPAMNTIMVGILLLGAICMASLKREVFPQFELEIILVTVPYPGASPDEVEEGICQKIEEAVRSINGLKKQTSVAQEGAGFCVLELETYVDVEKTLNDVRSEIDRIPSFPELAEDPEVEQITFREPAIRVGVIGPDKTDLQSELALREVTELVRNKILALPSVSQANISGSRPYQIDVEIPESRLREYGLTLQQVAGIIRQQNVELPGGSMKTSSQEILLRGKDKGLTGEKIAQVPLVTQSNGVVLKVADLGSVHDAFEDVAAINRIDGKPGLAISVDRTRSEDLLRLVEEVKEYVASAELPPGYSLKTWGDQSVDVRDRMNLLMKNGFQGLILVFFMLIIFLDLELSFWVALGIPIAVLGAGAVMFMGDKTLNMLTMFAFLMALGIVVDDAIVIGENIYAHRQLGKSGTQAAIDGTVEVVPSVTASVSTTIIAFMPLFFVSGVMGKFIAEMPLAVIAMLALSLVESILILPCHLAHAGERGVIRRMLESYKALPIYIPTLVTLLLTACLVGLGLVAFPWKSYSLPIVFLMIGIGVAALIYPFLMAADFAHWLSRTSNRILGWFINTFYLPTLGWCLRNSFLSICIAGSLMLMSFGLVTSGITPFIVFPKTDANVIEAMVEFPNGTPESITDQASKQIDAAIQRLGKRYEDGGEKIVKTILRQVGQVASSNPVGPDGMSTGSHVAKVQVELVESGQRETSSLDIIDEWREETGEIPGAELLTFGAPEMGPGGTAIEFKLLADKEHMEELERAADACKAHLSEYGGVKDIRDDSQPGKWEFQIKVKEKAKALGVSLTQLAATVRGSYYGEEVMRLQRGRHEVKLMVRYPPEERESLARFDEIRVRTDDGGVYPLTELAEVTVKRGYSEINRINQKRSVTVTADVNEKEGNARETVEAMKANFIDDLLADHPNVSVLWEGQAQQTDESVGSLFLGFGGALIAMYILLTMEFRSYFQPLIIMFIIPFGVVGAIWGHFAMGLTITMFTLFGLVALTGVVVNDSIVLIDFINLRVRDGVQIHEALLDAGRRRFRPVMLTSVTTIAGLTPLLTEKSFQAQFLIPLAATLVFGLLVATGLVLILIPSTYCFLFHDLPALFYWLTGFKPSDEEHDVTEEEVAIKPPSASLLPAK